MISKAKLAASLVLAVSATMANAATYSVQAEFNEPMTMMGGTVGNTLFSGTFDWDGTTFSNFAGTMNSSMASMVQDINLTYDLSTTMSGSIVTAAVFLKNTTDVFYGGGFTTGGVWKFGGRNGANATGTPDGNVENNNAYFLFSFDSSTMTGITNSIVYGDCTANGLMVTNKCMTGSSLGGTMGATPLSLSIAAAPVPVPAAIWLLGSALAGMGLFGRRQNVGGLKAPQVA